MPSKPGTRSWYDAQITIAVFSMASMLFLWNMFAGPDREKAKEKMEQEAQSSPPPPIQMPTLALTPTPITKIYFANPTQQAQAPSQPSGKNKKNRDDGGGGGRNAGGGGGGSTGTS